MRAAFKLFKASFDQFFRENKEKYQIADHLLLFIGFLGVWNRKIAALNRWLMKKFYKNDQKIDKKPIIFLK